MANETIISARLRSTKGTPNSPIDTTVVSKNITAVNSGAIENVQTIGTGGTQLVLGSVALPGYLFLQNLDASATISISLTAGAASNGSFAFLKAGEPCVIPTRQTTIYALANPTSAKLLVAACEV